MTGTSAGPPPTGTDAAKRRAGERAAEFVTEGMTLGLGTGSTARWFIDAVGRLVGGGMRLWGVPTSEASRRQAGALGIPLVELTAGGVDLAVDGADRVDPQLDLVKGFGAALLREKIVAHAARRFVIVIDAGKLTPHLGGRVPLEIAPFGHAATLAAVTSLGAGAAELRRGPAGDPVLSDNGGLIADLEASGEPDAGGLADALSSVPGVLGHGLFLGMADLVLVAGPDGVRELHRRS